MKLEKSKSSKTGMAKVIWLEKNNGRVGNMKQ